FYQALAAQRLVELREELAKLAADVTLTSRQLGNVGQADRPDILQAEVEEQQARIAVNIARQNLQSAWRVLAAVTGKSGMPAEKLAGDLDSIPELNYAAQVAALLRESPEVTAAEKSVEHAEASLTVERKAPIPDLQVSGTLAQNHELLDEITGRQTGLMGGVQVGIELPIFNRNQGRIAAAKAEVESSKQELARLRLQIERGMADVFRDYDAARLTALQYKNELLPRAEEAYRLYEQNYQRMAGAYPQVLISQRTLFQLKAEYVQALAGAWTSAIAIRGFGLSDGLAEPMGASMGNANAGGGARMGVMP
ncbi:MAG: TolC family protein, partial [Acidobacteriota bacterium]|nr:TolC family protein [Acidobacteriota bacterium]